MFNFWKTRKIRKQIQNEIKEAIETGPYANTLYNSNWLIDNQDKILQSLPDTWTHIDNLDFVVFGINMSGLNLPWENKSDLERFLSYFELINMLIRQNTYQVKRCYSNPFTVAANQIKSINS